MKLRYSLLALVLVAILAVAYLIIDYLGVLDPPIESGTRVVFEQDVPVSAAPKVNLQPVQYEYEIVADDLYVPWSIVFSSPNRMLVTERDGTIVEVVDDGLNTNPLITFPEVASTGEAGLMGMALHPNYSSNKYIYVCMSYSGGGGLTDKIERLVDNGDTIERESVILDSFPSARFHAGCRLRFGDDGKLYITTGDAGTRDEAQNVSSLAGKILRMNDDGSVPDDNPIANSLVYSLGHRNPQGIDWHPVSGELYSTEHGPSGFDGPGGGDELNRIVAGENYGWPEVSHENTSPEFKDPLLVFTPAEAPASGMFYRGSVFPQFTNQYFFGALRGEGIFVVEISDTDPDKVLSFEKLDINFGRIREISEGPDGLIYFTTSNRDGRGDLRDRDDKIYRFTPR